MSHVTDVIHGSEPSRGPFLSNAKPVMWQPSQPAGERTSAVPDDREGRPNGGQPVREQTQPCQTTKDVVD
jgi:hypothetical protein